MAAHAGPNLVTGSMSYFVDAGSRRSLNTIAGGWSDLTGNRPTATFANATFSATNVGTVFFGGTNSSSATVAESFFSTGSRTFDVWVKRDQNASTYNMVWGLYVPYLAMHNTGKFRLTYYYNTGSGNVLRTHDSTKSFVDGRWYNVTCTIEYTMGVSTVSKIYIDGVLDSTLATNSATTTAINSQGPDPLHNLILGSWHSSNPNVPLRGSISNFRIYERVLTDAEIAQNYSAMASRFRPDVAELAALHLDAANRNSFTRVQDGWSNLAAVSPTTFQLSGATYDPSNGGIITFAGTPGASASTTTFNQSTEMTWDVWIRRTANVGTNPLENYNMIFGHNSSPYLSFGGSNLPDRFVFSWYTKLGSAAQSQNWLFTPTNYLNNTWYNVTCTLRVDIPATTSTARILVNGVQVATTTTAVGSTNQLWPNSTTLRIAQHDANGTHPFNGSISNLRIYNRILTDAEILQSYNALKARFGY